MLSFWCLVPSNVPGKFAACAETCATFLECGPGVGDAQVSNCTGNRDFDESLGSCVEDGSSTTCTDFDSASATSLTSPTSPAGAGQNADSQQILAVSYSSGCVHSGVLQYWCMFPDNVPGKFTPCADSCADYFMCGPAVGDFTMVSCSGNEDFDQSLQVCVTDGTSSTCQDTEAT